MTSDHKPLSFNEILSHSVREGLTEALGSVIANALLDQVYENYDLTLEDLPNRVDTFFSILQDAFGVKTSRILSCVIAKRLYANLSIEFVENPTNGLPEYIEEIRKKVANL